MTGWADLVADQIRRVQRDLESTLDGLDPALLDQAPGPGANTIGWLAWHLTRSHDRNVSELRGAAQLWIASQWYERFGRTPDAGETGFGHTPAQLAAFRSPPAAELVAYHAAVVEMVLAYLRGAPEDDLIRSSPARPSVTRGPSSSAWSECWRRACSTSARWPTSAACSPSHRDVDQELCCTTRRRPCNKPLGQLILRLPVYHLVDCAVCRRRRSRSKLESGTDSPCSPESEEPRWGRSSPR